MLLSDSQLLEIKQLIADHHNAFIVNAIDPQAVTPEILEDLRQKGLVNAKGQSIEDAYLYGQVLAAAQDPKTATMSLTEFKAYLRRNPVPLTQTEQQAVIMNQQQAAQYVRGLGNRIDLQTGQTLINADHDLRRQMRDTITRKTDANIAARETVKKLKSDLGWATQDWTRDLDRIAITEKQSAMQQGSADAYAKRYGKDVMVAKMAMPDCCPRCAELYTGPDGMPRIFRLADLEKNGTNVGRRAAEMRPVVGPAHPHCVCTLIRVPAGWGFDANGDLMPGGEFGERYDDPGTLEASLAAETSLRKSLQTPGSLADFQGIPITIEHAAGSTRPWRNRDGLSGTTQMLFAYGYIQDTHGADGDNIDCYLGPNPLARRAYVVHQMTAQGVYDEDKVMLGFSCESDARGAYEAHYTEPRIGGIDAMSMRHFKRWLASQAPHDAPLKSGFARGAKRGTDKPGRNPPLVLPLQKANIPLYSVGPTQAAQHNPRLRGYDGANFLFNTPPIKPPVRDETIVGKLAPEKAFLTKYGLKPGGQGLRRDKKIYEYQDIPPRPVKYFRFNDQWVQDPELREKTAYMQREWLKKQQEQRATYHNYADVHAQTAKPKNPTLVVRLPKPTKMRHKAPQASAPGPNVPVPLDIADDTAPKKRKRKKAARTPVTRQDVSR